MNKDLEEWARKNAIDLMKIVKVFDVAFKYDGHNCRLTFKQCEKLANAHRKIKP